MEPHAAMLLNPKGYRKQTQRNGNRSTPSSPTPEKDYSTMTPIAPNEILAGSHSPGTTRQSSIQPASNRSSCEPSPSIAPLGTVPIMASFPSQPRDPFSSDMSSTSSPARNTKTNPEHDLTVQFTSIHGEEGNESDAKRSHYEISDSDDSARPRNLIEGIYDVEQRRHQTMKRMKIDNGDSNIDATKKPVTISGVTGLGQWMKDGQAKPSSPLVPALSDVVDLTADFSKTKDDDECQVTGSNDLSSQRVCYGKIESAMIVAFLVPKPRANPVLGDEALQWSSMKLDLDRQPSKENLIIRVKDPYGKEFGNVDAKTSQALCPLLDAPFVHLDIVARLDMRKKQEGEVVWQPTNGAYRASFTLYGERKSAEQIGNFLGQQNVWLGTPNFVENGVPVFNPHAERRRALAATAAANNGGRDRAGPAVRYEVRTAEEVNDAVMKMFDQLVSADIPTMEPPSAVQTPLLHHQKQALWFMTEKEQDRKFGPKEEQNNSLWRMGQKRNGAKQYREIISGILLDQEPPQVLGGLLADMMGLGKTLSILSLTVSTLQEAQDWAERMPQRDLIRHFPGIRNTRTTLLVVPLTAVNNWTQQVKEHLKQDSLQCYVFHGQSRTTNVDELAEYDLVITTYSTILSEVSGRSLKRRSSSPLAKMNMFRIVLDEAHAIREQNAMQTRAILSLHAQRRWSVTGTPIQNRLEDLLSVTKFLRLYPYDDRARFSQHIISPFKTGDPTVLASLRVLIDSFTLRRTKDRIKLPKRLDRIVTLSFSEKEHQLHEFFRNESNVMMRVIAGEEKTSMGGRMYHHVLKAMMILRQISAHGKELLDVDDRKRIKGLTVQDAIDLEEGGPDKASVTDKKAYDMLDLMKQSNSDKCNLCNKQLEDPLTDTGSVDKDAAMAYFLPCYHILCVDCFSGWKPSFDMNTDSQVRCTVCGGWIDMEYIAITPGGYDAFKEEQALSKKMRKHGKILGDYEGPHTKTIALVDHLKKIAAESETLIDEPPIKTVIFSAWTTHLDLIEIALRDNGLDSFVRLDGTMSLPARGKALNDFANDDSVTILLATIGAGGVGLNLTSASRVFIMEPQYNPAAVAQAVDRVHRLGQRRDVETFQFIMKSSIEEKILELAKKKQQLADMSMNRGKLDKREVQEARMREYRGLFK
ncbi:hypothetical protein N7462_007433 [Penicillium macrosclerotiorum]|uniref:uncharacterized protein n=1 Tax=Penicillium macrosclerotiorum TaxID=303699 RepID=UPI002548B7B5|nr:uncharacterized protein N7462_007433 [Penicillium macrosclerotiorum]KAJ5679189.1 hypothetical protein N7462_007433 [Penicillium macrosclerotiorum]